jgi:beta-lactamase superfamily II metal-dependent hydrolase
MRRSLRSLVVVTLLGVSALAQPRSGKALDIYVIDVEGGGATLYVAPSGESVLIDTGNGGAAGTRDVDRIMAAAKAAGLSRIDHLITTHWHGDHYGGLAELASRLPIRHFIDHGSSVESVSAVTQFLQTTYPALHARATHTVVKPGDTIPVAGLEWRVVTSHGGTIKSPLPGAGQTNPPCATFKPQPDDASDNAQSVGSVIAYGAFRAAHLGDLTWNKEFDLMCPANKIGIVDLFVVSHHGLGVSNSEALVHGLTPRVAVMNNGSRKGGPPEVMKTIYSSSGLEDLWQLHFSVLSGQEYTVPGLFIANLFDDPLVAMPIAPVAAPQPGSNAPPAPVHNGPAYWIKVSAQADGSFTVSNARNGFEKRYRARTGSGAGAR